MQGLPEKVLYLPKLAVQAVVHIDILNLFALFSLPSLCVSLLLVEVGCVVQIELRYHIQARPRCEETIRL